KGLNEEVVLKWSVATEANVAAYEIELARGNAELQAGHYLKIGSVTSLGNSTTNRNYSFTDNEADKFGPRYYRLKIVNLDGSFSYSPIRSVLFNETVLGRVYPNPSTGFFNLVFQIDAGNNFEAKVFDVKGSLVREYHRTATGLLQKLSIDLSAAPAGMYLLQTDAAGKRQAFKLYKN
ncbi:MAG TPA: T9SS type A sorting domain-containing protein, partial [Flavisolibacter sp.]|nr:T9SS type A sorting domain-containing protein [Flavisolibacter sp.]